MKKRELGLSISQPVENVFSCGLFDCIEYSVGASGSDGGQGNPNAANDTPAEAAPSEATVEEETTVS